MLWIPSKTNTCQRVGDKPYEELAAYHIREVFRGPMGYNTLGYPF